MTHPRVVIEADGGSRGNPGPAAYGAVLRDAETGEVIAETGEAIGIATNNVAEYRGLIGGLELYNEHTPGSELEVRMDSKLVVEQMAGRWKVKHPGMKPLAISAHRLAPASTLWTWVPRADNVHADRLVNEALDAAPTATAPVRSLPPAAMRDAPQPSGSDKPMLGPSAALGVATTLILVRPGAPTETEEAAVSGPDDDSGLTDMGRRQASRIAAHLASGTETRWAAPGAVVSSPLRRATETAAILGSALALPVYVDEGLRAGSADSVAGVSTRVDEVIERLRSTYAHQTVVVVSHVDPVKRMIQRVLDAPLDVVNRMQLAPGTSSTVQFFDSDATVLRSFSVVP